jgi:hypothetical protein
MGRPRSLKPKLCEHASSGRAYVTLDGKPVYLGKFGTQDAQDKYDCVIAEWIARGRKFDPTPTRPGADPAAPATAGPTLTTVIEPYWTFAKEYYRAPDGNPTSEIFSIKVVLRLLNRLYGGIPAAELDSLKLLALQEQMIGLGWARKTINKHMGRVKRALAWLASRKHIPATVYHEALTVKGIAAGRTKAKETDPVKPVPEAVVEATMRHLTLSGTRTVIVEYPGGRPDSGAGDRAAGARVPLSDHAPGQPR